MLGTTTYEKVVSLLLLLLAYTFILWKRKLKPGRLNDLLRSGNSDVAKPEYKIQVISQFKDSCLSPRRTSI